MKRIAAFLAVLCVSALAQNYAVPSASNIEDLNGNKLAAGTICFTGTDAKHLHSDQHLETDRAEHVLGVVLGLSSDLVSVRAIALGLAA